MAKEKFKVNTVKEALRASGGIYSIAAIKLNCAPNTVKNYVERHPTLKRALAEILFENLDIAEAELLKAIRNESAQGHMTAIIFYLKTKGKDRGYSERTEITGKGGGPVETKETGEKLDLSKLSLDELNQLEALAAKANPAAERNPKGKSATKPS